MKSFARRVVRRLRRQFEFLGYTTVSGPGYRIKVPRVQDPAAFDQNHEPWVDPLLETFFADDESCFLDVGANLGQFLVKLLKINPRVRYLGFEPNLECASHVSRIIELNQLERHVILPVGLSDEHTCATLYCNSNVDAAASMVQQFRPDAFYTASRAIVTCVGDEIIRTLGIEKIALIKIDVEGAELDVLRGLEQTLARLKPSVLFEVLPNFLLIGNQELDAECVAFRAKRWEALEQCLRRNGYEIHQILPEGGPRTVERIEPDAVTRSEETIFLAAQPGQLRI